MIISPSLHFVSKFDNTLHTDARFAKFAVFVLDSEPEVGKDLIETNRFHIHYGDEIESPILMGCSKSHIPTLRLNIVFCVVRAMR